jgi:hypothetical protein
MKIKLNARFLVLPLLAVAMVFALNQCKNVGSSDWPTPDPEVINQLKFSVFDGETGSTLQSFDLKVVLPDGSSKEFKDNKGAFVFDGTLEGNYVVTASKAGFLAESVILEVEKAESENISTITNHFFFLNQRGSASVVPPTGTTLTVETSLSTPTEIYFPEGALTNDENITITYIHPVSKHDEMYIIGERLVLGGYNFSPSLTFPEDAKPTISIPIDLPHVTDGNADVWFGSYDETTGTWEKVLGQLNEDRTLATFEMPHFSTWYIFTGYRLIKIGESWSPWNLSVAVSECSEGVCGTFLYAVSPTPIVFELIQLGYNINLKAKDTRCVGPINNYIQTLQARVRLINYEVRDYTGALVGTFQIPTKKFQWKVELESCHDQGGGK